MDEVIVSSINAGRSPAIRVTVRARVMVRRIRIGRGRGRGRGTYEVKRNDADHVEEIVLCGEGSCLSDPVSWLCGCQLEGMAI